MLTRAEAVPLLRKNLRTEKLWGITGLLHDLDYDFTKNDPEKHSQITVKVLNDLLPLEAMNAIKAHNYQYTAQIPQTYLDKSLIAADAVSGLIIAAALVMPSKKLVDVTPKTLLAKFKDKSFAAGCNRKRIELCEDMDLELQGFLELSLGSLKRISDSLGL